MRRALALLIPSVFAIAVVASACDVDRYQEVDGSGDIASDVRAVSGFARVSLQGQGIVVVMQGSTESLVVTTDDNLLSFIETEVVDGTLELRTDPSTDIQPTDSVRYEIGVRELEGLELSGAGTVRMDGWVTDAAEVQVSGAGELHVAGLTSPSLDASHSGAGTVSIEGTVQRQTVSFSGVGDYDAGELASTETKVDGSGVGAITLWATDLLDVSLSGVGGVSYYGAPELRQTISGVGTIESLGDR